MPNSFGINITPYGKYLSDIFLDKIWNLDIHFLLKNYGIDQIFLK